jgi:hypothetical protein
MFIHKVLRWKHIFMACVKRLKNGHVNSKFGTTKFIFFKQATKVSLSDKISRVNLNF